MSICNGIVFAFFGKFELATGIEKYATGYDAFMKFATKNHLIMSQNAETSVAAEPFESPLGAFSLQIRCKFCLFLSRVRVFFLQWILWNLQRVLM